ncbi:MAG: SAM-dependent methyltransferase [Ferruginibacter sp.]
MSIVYLIPSVLHEQGYAAIPAYTLTAIRSCSAIFAENERTTRRYLKALDKTIVIDDFEWFTIHKAEAEQIGHFKNKIAEKKNIAIISEAGCPGIADPGQVLAGIAQQLGCKVQPLTGPSAILLALMASGLSGQQFEFVGYLPVDTIEREKMILTLEQNSAKQNSTKIFIETPYRNNQLMESLIKVCKPATLLCIGSNITGANETIVTKKIIAWQKNVPNLHKIPAIFLLQAE